MKSSFLKFALVGLIAFCAYPFVDNAYKWNACVRQFKDLEESWLNQVNPLGVAVCNGAETDMVRFIPKK